MINKTELEVSSVDNSQKQSRANRVTELGSNKNDDSENVTKESFWPSAIIRNSTLIDNESNVTSEIIIPKP